MDNKSFFRENIAVGFMLFALFLGAGNIIFPPLLGQMAGENITISMIGFIITGVGLPLLGIIAVAKNGGDLEVLAGRVNPYFGIIFTSIVYLSVGPFFAIPRTGAVSFSIGIAPFLSEGMKDSWIPLFITTILFFGLTFYLAFNPTKIVDRVGKILTPALLIIICLLAIKSVITPMGEIGQAQGTYIDNAFGESFIQGYLTMDVLASLVFGIVIVQSLVARGVTEKAAQIKITVFAGIIAAAGLVFVYVSLGYIGVTSTSAIGFHDNGGTIISLAAQQLFGQAGNIILSAVIILACLTTSVGLLSANATFFHKIFPKISYKVYLVIFVIFSFAISNFGLADLIQISLPVLVAIYPIAIVLMVFALFGNLFNHAPSVYGVALIFTGVVALYDGIKEAGFEIEAYDNFLSIFPFYEQGIAWVVPALIGGVIGYIMYIVKHK
ncbi:branched-chain amino acid transport system II carrier protein [Solibacillus sp. MA9]|uniref:Branched-chain amino acid transport system carrier protein n=1 Tax=Solibacillus palustris TaxID=2908203 RepID=A0ABS9U8I3_9BACL|nr:branched-chain amino acid transport system II carrier protein [Solibacillus sp. MA9]MCH7320627.1 branched-chain amino acid transport system II carrier protein [Solibacillus sp. MA9]